MKSLVCKSLSPIAQQILDYLSTHEDAQDTIEGIAEWWLVEQRIRIVITEVKKALAELVDRGLLVARKGQDGRVHYRLNPRKRAATTLPLEKVSSPRPVAPKKAMAKRLANRR